MTFALGFSLKFSSFFFQIRQGVHVAFRTILEKRVVQSLSPILDNPKLDLELRGLIRTNLQEFCSSAPSEGTKISF